jgi:hypothetical protein
MTPLDTWFVNGYKNPSMTLQDIKTAVREGKRVCWITPEYQVACDNLGQWLILLDGGRSAWGLCRADGSLRDAESEFYVVGVQHAVEECA